MEGQSPAAKQGFCEEYEFIVVGAGIAGLQAAHILAQQRRKFLLLEAQSSVGGRSSTKLLGDLPQATGVQWVQNNPCVREAPVESGATYAFGDHCFMLALCNNFGIPFRMINRTGNNLYMTPKQLLTHKQLKQSKMGDTLLSSVRKISALADEYGREVLSSQHPSWTMLKKYDAITVAEFLDAEVSDAATKDFLTNILEFTECADCRENSMHEVLTKSARSKDIEIAEGFLRLVEENQWYMLQGGLKAFTGAFLRGIEIATGRPIVETVLTSCPVEEIDNSDEQRMKVRANHNGKERVFVCRRVILAAPVAVVNNIHISRLSQAKRWLLSRQLLTTVTKSFIITKQPFWEKQGFSGDCYFSEHFNINITHDASPRDRSCGELVFNHAGSKMKKWEEQFKGTQIEIKAQKKKYLLQIVAKLFLNDDVNHPELEDAIFVETTFANNKYIRSCFQANTKPNSFSKLEEMGEQGLSAYSRDEHGVIFVGSEYSDEFASYMEGAIRSARKKTYRELGLDDPFGK